MSKPLSYSYFQKQYMQRIAAGELFIPEPDSPAVDMFIAELNKVPQGDADFSVYKLDDIEWGDFLGDIFSSEEYRDHTETRFEYRAIVEDACEQSLRTFIGKIKKVDTKLALLKFFMSDDFRQNVLSKGNCAYGSSADMIQLQCAKLMGEINRSLHGEVAPDLTNVTDNLAANAGDEPVNNEQDIKKIIASLPTKQMMVNGKVVEIYQLPKDEEITPIGKLIASVNKGEVQARKADWKHLVQEGFRAEQTTPMTFIYWMQESLTDIKIHDYRVDALHTIIENLPAYLHEVGASDNVLNRYKQDCKNLLHYFRQIIYIIRYFDDAGRYWNEHRNDDQLDVETYLYFRFLDRIDDLKEYLAFSQAHYVAIHAKTRSFIPNIVAAQSEPYWDKLVTEDIISFCRSLYMAETTRLKYLAGWKTPFPALTIDTFDRKLRNRCFDLYIERRTKDICTELNKENRRPHDATPKECLIKLLETDTQEYQRLKTIGNLPGSIIYDQEWKPGTPDILAMAELFLQYLSQKMKSIPQDLYNMEIIHPKKTNTPDKAKTHCDFQFVIREYPLDDAYRSSWLWQDQSKYISINWNDLQAILAILPTADYQKPRIWLRDYLKNHSEVRINDWQEIFREVRALIMDYVEDYFRFNKEASLFGHDYDWFAEASLADVEAWLHISCWEHAFHNYAVPSYEIPVETSAPTTPSSSAPSSDAADYQSVESSFLWPCYTDRATDDDKRTFEGFLSKLCLSTKKSMTKDIKNYLAAKEGEKIITRPEQINTEYEWVKRFGYPRAQKTYYNS